MAVHYLLTAIVPILTQTLQAQPAAMSYLSCILYHLHLTRPIAWRDGTAEGI